MKITLESNINELEKKFEVCFSSSLSLGWLSTPYIAGEPRCFAIASFRCEILAAGAGEPRCFAIASFCCEILAAGAGVCNEGM